MKRIIVLALFLASPAFAAARPEDLSAWTLQLQKAPSDDALREKIIKLAATLSPAPTIPKEARRPFVMAATFQKDAKSVADYAKAINAYQEALLTAPWWGEAYYNLSVALESAKRYGEAKTALRFYLLGKPKDAEKAEDRLYALEARESSASDEKAKNLIVPGVGIGAVRIGMKEADFIAVLGAPSERHEFGGANNYHEVNDRWGTKPEVVAATFPNNGACSTIDSTQPRHHTAEGVGPGSSIAEVRAALGVPEAERDYGAEGKMICYARGVKFSYIADGKVEDVVVMLPSQWKQFCPAP